MKYRVTPARSFIRETKDLLKKFPRIKTELVGYLETLERSGVKGAKIPGFPDFWKDRLPMKAYNIGQSGGLRIISYHAEGSDQVIPVMIYHKASLENPASDQLKTILKEIQSEDEHEA